MIEDRIAYANYIKREAFKILDDIRFKAAFSIEEEALYNLFKEMDSIFPHQEESVEQLELIAQEVENIIITIDERG